jgi:hypothetical protein
VRIHARAGDLLGERISAGLSETVVEVDEIDGFLYESIVDVIEIGLMDSSESKFGRIALVPYSGSHSEYASLEDALSSPFYPLGPIA